MSNDFTSDWASGIKGILAKDRTTLAIAGNVGRRVTRERNAKQSTLLSLRG